MGYLNENGLARYDGLIKQWVTLKSGTVDGIDPLLNWQKTETAGAVTCYPLPAAPIDPVVNFQFAETGPVSGTKSPDNPSTITGVTQAKVTRCGKNLIPPQTNGTEVKNGVTFVIADGVYTATGTGGTGNSTLYIAVTSVPVLQDETYFISGCPAGGSDSTYRLSISFYPNDGSNASYLSETGSGCDFTPSKDGTLTVSITVYAGYEVSGVVFKPQVEKGSSATAFESPTASTYTVNLGGTYYGGSVDLSAGTMTVTWAKHVFSNSNQFSYNVGYANDTSSGFYLNASALTALGLDISSVADNLACSLFPVVTTSNFYAVDESVYKSFSTSLMLRINNSRLSAYGYVKGTSTASESVRAFGEWLADNPVELIYNLATPYTVQLTPTQIYSLSQPDPYNPRINTVYSDQVSVQVGYPKSPLATSTELTNAIISLGGNI